jgi:hypothetical protein
MSKKSFGLILCTTIKKLVLIWGQPKDDSPLVARNLKVARVLSFGQFLIPKNKEAIMDPNYVAREIEKYEALIEELRYQIQHFLQKKQELQCLAVLDEEGEVTSYADWEA